MGIRIGEMQTLFGLSANGVKLYEQYGLLHPRRDEQNQYRVYDYEDMAMMAVAARYRQYGYSIADTVTMICRTDAQEHAQRLDAQRARLAEEERRIHQMQRHLQTQAARMRLSLQLMDKCIFDEKPPMFNIPLRRGETDIAGQQENLASWIDRNAAFLMPSVLLDGPYFIDRGYRHSPVIGFAADSQMADVHGVALGKGVTYLPVKLCVVTGVRVSLNPKQEEFEAAGERIVRYAKEHGNVQIQGGGFCTLLQPETEGNEMKFQGLLWTPVEREDDDLPNVL